jgi:hypothetical protein
MKEVCLFTYYNIRKQPIFHPILNLYRSEEFDEEF